MTGVQTCALPIWSLKGKTEEALYAEWQALKFDPSKDDIEDFFSDVKTLTKALSKNEREQVIAIKNAMPLSILPACQHLGTVKDLKELLVGYFDNPRVKRESAMSNPVASTSGLGALASIESVPRQGNSSSKAIGKLVSSLNGMQAQLNSISNSRVPYKPRITQGRGRFQKPFDPRGRNRQNNYNNQGNNQGYQSRDRSRPWQGGNRSFRPRGNFRGGNGFGRKSFNPRPFNAGQGRRFDSSPNVRRPRIAGKAIDKDKDRCHYCKEIGHFMKDCDKRKRDEKKSLSLHAIAELNEDEGMDIIDSLDSEIAHLNI